MKNSLSKALQHQLNPVLLALQILTVEIKDEKGQWPENSSQYSEIYGDSINALFSEFQQLEYKIIEDSLLVFYALKNEKENDNYFIEFVDRKTIDSVQTKINSKFEVIDNEKNFNHFEGKMTLYKVGNTTYINHEFQGGINRIFLD